MGEDMYIATSPSDVAAVYRDTQKLDFDAFIKDVMRDFGCTEHTIGKMFDSDGRPKHWMDKTHDDFRLQMHPGDRLKVVESRFLGNIDRLMSWESISGASLVQASGHCKTVSLWNWCWSVLSEAATQAFFGDVIFQVAPNILEDFWKFNLEAWKMHSKYPRFAAPRVFEAKDRSVKAFADYLSLPKDERPGACWLVEQLEVGMGEMGITEPTHCGAMLFSLQNLSVKHLSSANTDEGLTSEHSINANAYRQCFWCVAYLLHDRTLLEEIRKEIQPAWKNGSVNMAYLLESCPLLASFYEEMLRVNNEYRSTPPNFNKIIED